jgi:hypothetical protein
LGRPRYTKFMAIPNYTYLKLKIPAPKGSSLWVVTFVRMVKFQHRDAVCQIPEHSKTRGQHQSGRCRPSRLWLLYTVEKHTEAMLNDETHTCVGDAIDKLLRACDTVHLSIRHALCSGMWSSIFIHYHKTYQYSII